MIEHMNTVPSETTRDCILDTLLAQIKAFMTDNANLWKNIVHNIPTDIWTRKESEKFLDNVNIVDESSSEKVVKKQLRTMDKRFANRKYREKLE